MAIKKDLKINAGASFRMAFRLKDSNGSVLSIDGYTAKSQIRSEYLATEALCTFNIDVDEVEKTFILELSATESIKLQQVKEGKNAVWDVFITSPTGFVTKVIKGSVIVDKAATA